MQTSCLYLSIGNVYFTPPTVKIKEITERTYRSSNINSINNKNSSSSTPLFIYLSSSSSSSSIRLSSISPANPTCLKRSPMFAANNTRKRSGCRYANNNIEPSSPKVTCIGQVRVKTRKHVTRKIRAKSKTSLRRSSTELSNGCRYDANENRWVHFPLTICESLRSINCFSPCSKRREIELVVDGEEDDDRRRRRSRRRHVFEELDISAMIENKDKEEIERCPPKNALLLMRSRSDPVKVAVLANRVREREMLLNDVVQEDERRRFELEIEDKKRIELCEKWISGEIDMTSEVTVTIIEAEIEDDIRNVIEEERTAEIEDLSAEVEEREERKEVNEERSEQGNQEPDPCPKVVKKIICEKNKTTPYKVLPDSLLLMMCEPKLSMEVSKETWVCSTNFVSPGKPPAKKIPVVTAVSSRRRSVDKPLIHQALLQPSRSSCSYPTVGEMKLAGVNKAYETSMLRRCKSEPRKSASKLAPETCLWKNRKLEPHYSPVTVSAAGVGF